MLAHSQYESMFSSTALVQQISYMCRFVRNIRTCMRRNYVPRILCRLHEQLTLSCGSPDCHGIVAVLAISGNQPSSGLLHTLRFFCVCVWPLSAVCYNIASSSSHRGSTLVFPGTRSHVSPHRLTSTTQPLCHCSRVYYIIHNILLYT